MPPAWVYDSGRHQRLRDWRAGREEAHGTNQNRIPRVSRHFRLKLLNSTASEAPARLGPSCLARPVRVRVLPASGTLRRKVSPLGRSQARGQRVGK